MLEAHSLSAFLELIEFPRGDISLNRKMTVRRLEILTDGEEIAVHGSEVLHSVLDFIRSLPQASHNPGLCSEVPVQLLGAPQHMQRTLVVRLRTHRGIQTGDGLDIVVEDVGAGTYDDVQSLSVPQKVGDKHLDPTVRSMKPDLLDGLSEMDGSPVF